ARCRGASRSRAGPRDPHPSRKTRLHPPGRTHGENSGPSAGKSTHVARSFPHGSAADYEHATIVALRIDPPGRRDYRRVPEDAAMSVNKVLLIGNLGKDPEVRFTGGGQAVARFPVATSEVWNDREGQRQEHTDRHNLVGWGKQAETCGQYLQKGRQVYVEGSIRTRQYDDKDGNRRYIT